jgi:hypothetical protein
MAGPGKAVMNPTLAPPDSLHLRAAQGWLELGNHVEASEELEKTTSRLRAHPDVLEMRWQIYAATKKWENAVEAASAIAKLLPDSPFGWIHWACFGSSGGAEAAHPCGEC